MNSNEGFDNSERHDRFKEKAKEEVDVVSAPTKMRNWGNSMGVIIPKDIARKVGADVGSEFDLKVVEGSNEIRLVPRKQRKQYTLAELLSKCKPENQHGEIDLGIEGNELI
ncbi:AbrB/MazE/SpoVT family DNA-binding domain-containing protein [Bacillus sp. NEAU-Y102]